MEIREFKSLLPKGKAILGFDYGEKRLGVAVSDLLLMTANPVTIIQRTTWDKDLAQIKKIIAEKEVGGLVYGLPLQMNGEKGETADKAQKFALKLAQEINLPYIFWDERLSSRAVENFLISEVDMSRAKRKQKLDANAAAYILQGVLDALSYC
ncbi:MAG: Holliday junction resolvase RuvX [Alphaproteobacteria bacterium]|nr:Holliday junction resolvase RuvX [Alphaproteobacteria bacterium]